MNDTDTVLNTVYGGLATYKPDVLSSLAQHLSLDNELTKNFIYSSLVSKEENEIKQLLTKAVKNDLEKIVKAPVKEKNVNIDQILNPTQQKLLENSFQDFNITYGYKNHNAHAFAAAHRQIEFRILLQKIAYHHNRDYTAFLASTGHDVYFVDIGSNFPAIFKAGYEHVHCCSPILSPQDSNRFTNRYNNIVSCFANDTLTNQNQLLKATQIRSVLTGEFTTSKFLCLNRAQMCDVTAPYLVSLHSVYDMSNSEIAAVMLKKKSNTMVGTFMYTDKMLVYDKGVIDALEVQWIIDRKANTITFIFKEDASNPYVHDLDNYFKLIITPVFYSSDNAQVFYIELLENINGVQFFKINRQLHAAPGNELIYHQIPVTYFDDKYRVKFFIKNKDMIAKYYKGLLSIASNKDVSECFDVDFPLFDADCKHTCNSLLEAANISIVQATDSELAIEFYYNKELVEALMSFAFGCTETKFKPLEVYAYARSYSAKIFVGKTVVHRYKTIQSVKLFNLAHAVYLYVYDMKYNQGKVMQDLIQEIDWNRRLESMSVLRKLLTSSPAKITGNNKSLTLWQRFDAWLYNKKRSNVSTITFITEAASYITTVKTLPANYRSFRNPQLRITLPDCALSLFTGKLANNGEDLNSTQNLISSITRTYPIAHSKVNDEFTSMGYSSEELYHYDNTEANPNIVENLTTIFKNKNYLVLDITKLYMRNGALSPGFVHFMPYLKHHATTFNADRGRVNMVFHLSNTLRREKHLSDTYDKNFFLAAYMRLLPDFNEAVFSYNVENFKTRHLDGNIIIDRKLVVDSSLLKFERKPVRNTFKDLKSIFMLGNLKLLVDVSSSLELEHYKLPRFNFSDWLNDILNFKTEHRVSRKILVNTIDNEPYYDYFKQKGLETYFVSNTYKNILKEESLDYASPITKFNILDSDCRKQLGARLLIEKFNTIIMQIPTTYSEFLPIYFKVLNLYLQQLVNGGELLLIVSLLPESSLLLQLLYYLYLNFSTTKLLVSSHENIYSNQLVFHFLNYDPNLSVDELFDNDSENYCTFTNNYLYSLFEYEIAKILRTHDDIKYSMYINLTLQANAIRILDTVKTPKMLLIDESDEKLNEGVCYEPISLQPIEITNYLNSAVTATDKIVLCDSKTLTSQPEDPKTIEEAIVTCENNEDHNMSTYLTASDAVEPGFKFCIKFGNILHASTLIVHTISADAKCSAGVAKVLDRKFKYVSHLRKQQLPLDKYGVYLFSGIISLVTKNKFFEKPTLADMIAALENLKTFLTKACIAEVSMPKIGCGLDRLSWDEVSCSIQRIFCDTDITINVYTFDKTALYPEYLTSNSLILDATVVGSDSVNTRRNSVISDKTLYTADDAHSQVSIPSSFFSEKFQPSSQSSVNLCDSNTIKFNINFNGTIVAFDINALYTHYFDPSIIYRTLITRGDGKCLFYSLTRGLVAVDSLIDYIRSNTSNIEPDLAVELDTAFGGSATIKAFVELFKVTVILYDFDTHQIYVFSTENSGPSVVEISLRSAHYSSVVRTCARCTRYPVSLGYGTANVPNYLTYNLKKFDDYCLMCTQHKDNHLIIPYANYNVDDYLLITTFSDTALASVPMFALVDVNTSSPEQQHIYFHLNYIGDSDDKFAMTDKRMDLAVDTDACGRITNFSEFNTFVDKFLKGGKVNLHIPLRVDISPIFSITKLKNSDYEIIPVGEPSNPVDYVVLPTSSKINVLKNSMNEIRYIWYVTERTIAENLKNTFNEIFKMSGQQFKKKFTIDTSVGIIDLKNKQYLWRPVTEHQDINYVYGVQTNTFIPVESKFFKDFELNTIDQYVIFNKSTKIMNEQSLYSTVSHFHYDPKHFEYEISFVEGVPGAGKTTFILNQLQDDLSTSQVVFTATNESANEIKLRFMQKYSIQENPNTVQQLRLKFRNMDTALINVKRYKNVHTLFIDEALMRHVGQIYWLAYLLKVKKLVICGDSCQIPYFNNEGLVTNFSSYKGEYPAYIEYLTVSYRIPCDVAAFLNLLNSYKKSITTLNPVVSSINRLKIQDINSVHLQPDAICLVFSRAEKAELLQSYPSKFTLTNLFTVGEYQGKQHSSIVLIRINEKNNPLFESVNQFVVALSRHTDKFTYCTVVEDKLYSLLGDVLLITESELSDFKHEKLKGGGSFSNYMRTLNLNNRFFPRYSSARQLPDSETVVKPDFAVNLNDYSKVPSDLVLNHGYTGYIPMKFMFKLDDTEIFDNDSYIDKLEPPIVSNPRVIIQDTLDSVFPGSTLYDTTYDYRIFDIDPLILNSTNFAFVDDFRTAKLYDTFSNRLRTSVPGHIPICTKSILKTFNERNGCVPTLNGRIEPYLIADGLIDKFLNTYMVDPLFVRTLKNFPIQINVDTLHDWFETQNPDIINQIIADDSFSIYDKSLTQYQYILKRMAKPSLDTNPHTKFSSPQAIAFQDKKINSFFCSITKELKNRIIANIRKNFIINCDMSTLDLQKILNHRITPKRFLDYAKRIEFDISKYDKSQGMEALLFEVRLMEVFGVPEEIIATWIFMHVKTRLYSVSTKFEAEVDYQRKSGDAMTYLGNTTYFMSILASIVPLTDSFCMFSGDDSYVATNSYIDTNFAVAVLANTYNFEVKVFEYVYPYFCSKFFVPIDDDRWLIVPDLIKLAIKLGRTDLLSYQHVKDYRISLVDLISTLHDYTHYDAILPPLQERYKCQNISIAFVLAIRSIILDVNQFNNLFFLKPGDKLSNFTTLPSIDI